MSAFESIARIICLILIITCGTASVFEVRMTLAAIISPCVMAHALAVPPSCEDG